MIHFILGGARSGKSRFAESLVYDFSEQGRDSVYIATAQALDDEMAQRIAQHKMTRSQSGVQWQVIECPLLLSQGLVDHMSPNSVILVDCLTLWLTNQLLHNERHWSQVKADFLQTLTQVDGELILVSNEVGLGIVPMGEINRRFIDEAGWLHQDIAQLAERVTLITAGLPQHLKGGD
ncbi:bifunctional adenosylcobinamide kinase/adenosylcobinamide-phosphate guanylyltransferase [uncultured Shewanella sp.]|uniref:bifunctional adenosylcobinamide kinase/adenosylcobinamide-phosphate guanylyltransferase n=1 Tax=uncultured Shewanella sp. TaxID=173975 RepID=UPI00261E1853|nr:bifunctional adenosylcobinamide kinase/adenosylcobinamide-phosphate guanylyltransferase [uncultured Shewanella sp.]